nr:periplasmic heavy metal sensor [Gemmatimonas sp. UBA7669]
MPSAAGSSAPASVSQIPGNAGSSHLNHIGATGFFLDQPQLQLSASQQTTLNGIKSRALLARAESERQVQKAEEELWALTGSAQPDATAVEAKVREVERLRAGARLDFIAAVREATNVLTAAQRRTLLGTAP